MFACKKTSLGISAESDQALNHNRNKNEDNPGIQKTLQNKNVKQKILSAHLVEFPSQVLDKKVQIENTPIRSGESTAYSMYFQIKYQMNNKLWFFET